MTLPKWIDLPPVWLVLFMALAWGMARVVPVVEFAGPAALWAGRALIALGLGVMVWAAVHFRRQRTTIIPHQAPSALVTSGPFALSRNPIYLADLVILAGWTIQLGALSPLILIWPLARILQTRFILPEEARLTAAFQKPSPPTSREPAAGSDRQRRSQRAGRATTPRRSSGQWRLSVRAFRGGDHSWAPPVTAKSPPQ